MTENQQAIHETQRLGSPEDQDVFKWTTEEQFKKLEAERIAFEKRQRVIRAACAKRGFMESFVIASTRSGPIDPHSIVITAEAVWGNLERVAPYPEDR